MKNETKTQLLLKPAQPLAKKLARDAQRQSCSQQTVVNEILTSHYWCRICGKVRTGENCKTCKGETQ